MSTPSADPTFDRSAGRMSDPTAEIDALLEEAKREVNARPQAALDLSRRARERAAALDDPERLARAWQREGVSLIWLGDYPGAIRATSEALLIAPDDPEFRAWTLNNLGVAYAQLGDSATALEYYGKSLDLQREARLAAGLAMTLHNIGIERRKLGDAAGARPFYEEALALDLAGGDRLGEGRTRLSLGVVHFVLGELDAARARFGEALAIARDVDDATGLLQTLENLAELEIREGRADLALDLAEEQLRRARAVGSREREASAWGSRGQALHALGRPAEARDAFERGLALAEGIGAERVVADFLRGLADACESVGDLSAALGHLRRLHDLDRRLANRQAEARAQALGLRHGLEQAQQRAELERARREELAAANAALQAQASELERLSREDGLTGLLNRRRLDERLDELFARARADGTPLAVALADVDHFKRVNDTFGHATGDDVLRAVGALFRAACPDGGLAARYGGEEFVLVLPGLGPDAAREHAEALRRTVEAHGWRDLHPDLAVTLSVGLADAAGHPHHERLLAAADARLYGAKRGGRNRVEGP